MCYINKAAIAIQTLLFCESGEGEWHSYLADDSKPSMTKYQCENMTVDGIEELITSKTPTRFIIALIHIKICKSPKGMTGITLTTKKSLAM